MARTTTSPLRSTPIVTPRSPSALAKSKPYEFASFCFQSFLQFRDLACSGGFDLSFAQYAVLQVSILGIHRQRDSFVVRLKFRQRFRHRPKKVLAPEGDACAQ